MTHQKSEQLELFLPPGTIDPGIGDDAEVISVLDRLKTLQMEDGFSPSSRGELNEAWNLRTFIPVRGGTAKHLAEVAIHQGKYGHEAGRATASITRDYVLYAGGARTDIAMLKTLAEELDELSETNRLAVVPRESVATGLGQLVRYKDLRELGNSRDFSQFPFSPLRPYNKDLPRTYDPYVQPVPPSRVQIRIDEVLETTRLWEAKRETQLAISEQRARHEFWAARLQEIDSHSTGVTRAVAAKALEGFGLKPVVG